MPWGLQVSRRSPTLNVGRLRNQISIVRVSSVQDSTGGTNLSVDVLYANVWASVEAQGGGDSANGGGGFVSKVTHQIVIRYLAGVTAAMQVQFQGRQFQIEAVQNPDERNKILILQCIEINDSAQQRVA
jgi:SPP1 family predicted phage head-tail adaptor